MLLKIKSKKKEFRYLKRIENNKLVGSKSYLLLNKNFNTIKFCFLILSYENEWQNKKG